MELIKKEFGDLEKIVCEMKIPLTCEVEVSYKCNFKCTHCFNKYAVSEEMDIANYKLLFDRLQESKVFTVTLTGGEFLTHKYYKEIINIFTEYKFEKCIYTNASLITLEVARFLKNRNIKLEISLYGMSPETYEAITGKAENYYKVMNALDYLKEEKIEFKLKATFTKQNFHERDKINKFIELMNSESPAQVARLMGNHSGVVDMRLDDEEMISILKTDLYLENEEFLPYGTCSGGITQYCIRPNGDMTPCLGFHSIIMGNILKNPYREIIEKFSLNRELNCKEITCNTCDKTKFCSPCPMIFYQDTGSHLKVSQESCRIAALKQQVHNERALEESNLCVNQN